MASINGISFIPMMGTKKPAGYVEIDGIVQGTVYLSSEPKYVPLQLKDKLMAVFKQLNEAVPGGYLLKEVITEPFPFFNILARLNADEDAYLDAIKDKTESIVFLIHYNSIISTLYVHIEANNELSDSEILEKYNQLNNTKWELKNTGVIRKKSDFDIVANSSHPLPTWILPQV